KFPPLRANSVERDIGPYVTQEANESSRHASAHLPSRSPSGREQSERARRAARASRYSGSFREDNVSPRRWPESRTVSGHRSSQHFRFAICDFAAVFFDNAMMAAISPASVSKGLTFTALSKPVSIINS